MKISDKPTEHLLISIYLDSRLLNCKYAIVHITDEWKRTLQERLALVSILKNTPDFTSITFEDESAKFYINPKSVINGITDNLLPSCDYAYVIYENNDLLGMEYLHQFTVVSYAIDITPNRSAKFIAYYGDGIHIHSEEFLLDDIL
ncbi:MULTISPECIES: hypothetical protein [Sphingobacterium]|uniref:hypothetical protein n=1 Tax=Sphingobacterium TaxID=28453 RepID=UPI0028ACF52E|nr:hypothetical protein [Sphingobacterium multivorum]